MAHELFHNFVLLGKIAEAIKPGADGADHLSRDRRRELYGLVAARQNEMLGEMIERLGGAAEPVPREFLLAIGGDVKAYADLDDLAADLREWLGIDGFILNPSTADRERIKAAPVGHVVKVPDPQHGYAIIILKAGTTADE